MEIQNQPSLSIEGYKFASIRELAASFPAIDFSSFKNAHICNAFGKPALGRSSLQKLNQRAEIDSVVVGDDRW